MSYEAWQAIANTPWWVYVIILALLVMGYFARQPRFVNVKLELYCQSLFLITFISIVFYLTPINLFGAGLAFCMLFTGFLMGWLHFYLSGIQAVPGKKMVFIPGSYQALFIVLTLITVKYIWLGHAYFIDIHSLSQPKPQTFLLSFTGLVTGLFLGRVYYILRCLKKGPFFHKTT